MYDLNHNGIVESVFPSCYPHFWVFQKPPGDSLWAARRHIRFRHFFSRFHHEPLGGRGWPARRHILRGPILVALIFLVSSVMISMVSDVHEHEFYVVNVCGEYWYLEGMNVVWNWEFRVHIGIKDESVWNW